MNSHTKREREREREKEMSHFQIEESCSLQGIIHNNIIIMHELVEFTIITVFQENVYNIL